ncbi:MAG: 3-deoxy-D-manno-octulosonic acid transferase [Dinoroseobacter sp.]|nr:3-deoxy-D-manno-octulosonic acid transferase [Dinoroseobacter sp.]
MALTARASRWADRKLAQRLAEGKEDPDRLGERKGQTDTQRPEGSLIWMHAASVGEALSVQELIRRLTEERPDVTILLTTGTRTSADLVATRLPPQAIHQFAPVDTGEAVNMFLDHWRPDLAIWVESELWPRLIHDTAARNIPMALINARMSQESARRWRWMKGTARTLLSYFSIILVQDQATGKHLSALGAPDDRMQVIGTLKEGAQVLPCSEEDREAFIKATDTRPRWLAASTHPGEEAVVAAAHKLLVRKMHRLLLILVPRHPERGPEVAKMLREDGWEVALRSADEPIEFDTQIYVADTLGEMGLWYRVAPISFIAGSLEEIGGHNPFEPAALGSAILHGPHVKNFADIYQRLAEVGAARLASTPEGLAASVEDLLSPDKAARMAHAAWEVSSRGAEVTDVALNEVLTLLEDAEAKALLSDNGAV